MVGSRDGLGRRVVFSSSVRVGPVAGGSSEPGSSPGAAAAPGGQALEVLPPILTKEDDVEYSVRKGKRQKWWVVQADDRNKWVDGPYDSKKEAEDAKKRLSADHP